MLEISHDMFLESAICYFGDRSISIDNLYTAIQNGPTGYSGTSVALYEMEIETSLLLLKVFSRNWSRHTKDFCEWAYGHELHTEEIFHLCTSLISYIQRLRNYGLDVDMPLSIWEIPDLFQRGTEERSLAIIVKKYSEPSIRKTLFDLRDRNDKDQILRIFKDHIYLLLQVILVAEKLGDVSEYIIDYGVDLKDRNLILAERWVYVDVFPVLTPFELKGYRKRAPMKAFMKRFDTRYYIYDLLFRYYKIVPDMIHLLSDIAQDDIKNYLGTKSADYCDFLSRYLDAYLAKWGHMPPDKDWQHPFVH